MDGLQARLRQSLQFQLSAWLSGAIVLLALSAGAYSFWTSFEEANELQDDLLRQVAALIVQHAVRLDPPAAEANPRLVDADLKVVAQVLGSSNNRRPGNGVSLDLSVDLPNGLQTVRVGSEDWRVLVRATADQERVAVAQQTAARDETARDSALRTVLPLLLLVPVLVLVVSLVVRRQLRPIARLASEMDRRSENDLTPLPPMVLPVEIRPFAASTGRLMARLQQSIEVQRRFVADAAHELRSPLTAISLQAEALRATGLSPHAQEQVVRLRTGLQRARALVDQLLAFARSQARPQAPSEPFAMGAVLRAVLEELMPVAESRHVDLGLLRLDAIRIEGIEADLYAIVRNLVDNAIRYGPTGGRVDVSLHQNDHGDAIFEVADDGPGIAMSERERVFDPFYRVLGTNVEGSGLGLAIVKTLAERMGASVTLHDAQSGAASPGLRVRVHFTKALVRPGTVGGDAS